MVLKFIALENDSDILGHSRGNVSSFVGFDGEAGFFRGKNGDSLLYGGAVDDLESGGI